MIECYYNTLKMIYRVYNAEKSLNKIIIWLFAIKNVNVN